MIKARKKYKDKNMWLVIFRLGWGTRNTAYTHQSWPKIWYKI